MSRTVVGLLQRAVQRPMYAADRRGSRLAERYFLYAFSNASAITVCPASDGWMSGVRSRTVSAYRLAGEERGDLHRREGGTAPASRGLKPADRGRDQGIQFTDR